MGVAVQQGEVLTDPAWRSDSFVPKGFTKGVLKARQLKPCLLSAQVEHTSPKPHRQVSAIST